MSKQPINKQPARVKPISKSLPLVITGKDSYGNDYDADSASTLISDLQNNDVFTKLTVMATVAKKICFNKEDARGVTSIARIMGYNHDTGDIELLFYGKNVEFANNIDGMVIVPRVRTNRDTNEVTTITAFEIVPEMEA